MRASTTGRFNDDDVEVVEGVEERDKMVALDEYKLAQEAILQSLAAAEQEAIRAEDDAEQVAVASGEKPLEDSRCYQGRQRRVERGDTA